MGKLIKFTLWVAGIGILLAILLVAAVALFFDPNEFRGKITSEAKSSTGRDLTVGDIRLSIYPVLGARIRNVTIGNAAGFGPSPFATVAEASVGVQLVPLLARRDIEIGSISVDGLQLNLERHANGTTNWDDLIERQSASTEGNPPGASTAAEPWRNIRSINIGAVAVSSAALEFRDDRAGRSYTLSKLELKTGPVTPGRPFDLELKFTTALGELTGSPGVTADAEISGTFDVDGSARTFDAKGFKAKLEATGSQIPGGKQKAQLNADLHFDGAKGDFRLDGAKLLAADLDAEMTLVGDGFNGGTPHFTGPLTLKAFSPRDVLKAFAIPLETADASALKNASLSTTIDGREKGASLSNVQMTLDESRISGTITIRDFASQAVDFALSLDRINMDRYMPPAHVASATPATATPAKNGDDQPIPLEALDKVNASGTLEVANLKLQGLSMSDAHLKLSAPKGAQKQIELNARLYGGSANSTTRIASGSHPTYAETLKLASVSIEPLLKDFNGKDKISGDATIGIDVTSSGRTVGEAKRALNGDLTFNVKNGAVKNFNLAEIVRRGQALLNGQALSDDVATSSQQTDFSALTGSGKFVNGVLHADQLDAQSPLFRLSGAGQVDLVDRTLDYLLKPTFVNTLSGQGGKELDKTSGVMIPVHLTGSLDRPHYALDVKSALEQKAAQKLLERVESGKLGDKINNALGKIFGGRSQTPAGQPPPQNAPNP